MKRTLLKTITHLALGGTLLLAPALAGLDQSEAGSRDRYTRSGSRRYVNGRWVPVRTSGSRSRSDYDRDGIPNHRDRDDDNDGIRDSRDPNDRSRTYSRSRSRSVSRASRRNSRYGRFDPRGDWDYDGIPNNRDNDRDNDGVPNRRDRHDYNTDRR